MPTDLSTLQSTCGSYVTNKKGMSINPTPFTNMDPDGILNPCGMYSLLYQDCKLTSLSA